MTSTSITNNQISTTIAHNLAGNMKNMKSSIEKISSGNKISHVGENPTGFAIGKSLKIDSNSLESNYINSRQAMSLVQTADIGLEHVKVMLQEILSLTAEAVSDTSEQSREFLQNQIMQYSEQIGSVIANTSFNNISLLDGSISGKANMIFNESLLSSDFKTQGAFDNNSIINISFGSSFNNTDLLGSMPSISASYNSSNDVSYSVNIGTETYSATNSDTFSQNIVRLQNINNANPDDYIEFDMALISVTNSAEAELLESQINDAFKTVTITQTKEISNYSNQDDIYSGDQIIGSLTNSKILLESNEFSPKKIANIDITGIENLGDDALFSVDIDGDTYSAEIKNGSLASGAELSLISIKNPHSKLIFKNGDKDLNLASKYDTNNFKNALNNAFNIQKPKGITFQTGLDSSDYINVKIPNMNLSDLLKNNNIDISSTASAQQSVELISKALNEVVSAQSLLGNTYNRFEHISDQLSANITHLEGASSHFLDTDYSLEVANKEIYDVLTKTSIAMLKQANDYMSEFLKLLD